MADEAVSFAFSAFDLFLFGLGETLVERILGFTADETVDELHPGAAPERGIDLQPVLAGLPPGIELLCAPFDRVRTFIIERGRILGGIRELRLDRNRRTLQTLGVFPMHRSAAVVAQAVRVDEPRRRLGRRDRGAGVQEGENRDRDDRDREAVREEGAWGAGRGAQGEPRGENVAGTSV